MAFQTVFKRYELKYILTREQQGKVLEAMSDHMIPDRFGRTIIRNLYYDTDDYILARHSIDKPAFKEKLRVRSYEQAGRDSTVFVELKRKCGHLVYKRRVALPEVKAMNWMSGQIGSAKLDADEQKKTEIDYFLDHYPGLKPVAFISYERIAYKMREGEGQNDFRITFDENILFRDNDLSLRSRPYGKHVLYQDKILMEIKCSGGIPLWMVEVLSSEHIYKTSFSKYGTAYTEYILPELMEEARREAQLAAKQPAREPIPQTVQERSLAAAASRHAAPQKRSALRPAWFRV